jgi:cell division cycle 20-like protein 1 (cofactor of APC complex)
VIKSSPLLGFNKLLVSDQSEIYHRDIDMDPYLILDAPDISDNFFLSILDWSTHGLIAIGVGSCVYISSS